MDNGEEETNFGIPEIENLTRIEQVTTGVAHTMLGFNNIKETSDFLKACVLAKIIQIQILRAGEVDDINDQSAVMKTTEIHPKKLKKDTRRLPSYEEEEIRRIILGKDHGANEQYFEMRERILYILNQVIVLAPAAQYVREEEKTVAQWLQEEQARLQKMREASRRAGCGSRLIDAMIYAVIIVSVATIVLAILSKINPEWGQDMRSGIQKIFKGSDEEAGEQGQ